LGLQCTSVQILQPSIGVAAAAKKVIGGSTKVVHRPRSTTILAVHGRNLLK